MQKVARKINASVLDTDAAPATRPATRRNYDAVDDARFRVAVAEEGADESDRPMYRGYADALRALQHLAKQLPALIAAARDPFAAGAAATLVGIGDAFAPFNDGCAGATLAILLDGARSVLEQRTPRDRQEG